MFLFIVLSIHLAVAEPAPCMGDQREDYAIPAADQTDVPIDFKPMVSMTNVECAPTYYDMTVLKDGEEVFTQRVDIAINAPMYMTFEENLEPDTDYIFRVVPTSADWFNEYPFRTGSHTMAELEGSPSGTFSNVSFEVIYDESEHITFDTQVSADLWVYSVPDPDELSVLTVTYTKPVKAKDLVWMVRKDTVGPHRVAPSWMYYEALEEVCFSLRQHKSPTVFTEPTIICHTTPASELEEGTSNKNCGTLTPISWLGFLAMGLVALRRRTHGAARP